LTQAKKRSSTERRVWTTTDLVRGGWEAPLVMEGSRTVLVVPPNSMDTRVLRFGAPAIIVAAYSLLWARLDITSNVNFIMRFEWLRLV
jgi:hypothetical protein